MIYKISHTSSCEHSAEHASAVTTDNTVRLIKASVFTCRDNLSGYLKHHLCKDLRLLNMGFHCSVV